MSWDTSNNRSAENIVLYNISIPDNSEKQPRHKLGIGSTDIIAIITLIFNYGSILLFSMMLKKYKHRKIMKASSPMMLAFVLLGSALQYTTILVALFVSNGSTVMCVVTRWFHLSGFTITYGALGLRLWRVSVILQFYKSRLMRIRDKELGLRLFVMVLIIVVFLITYTVFAIHIKHNVGLKTGAHCLHHDAWSYMIDFGQLFLLSWVGIMCIKTRLAPSMYNDNIQTGLAIWNHATFTAAFMLARYAVVAQHSHRLGLVTPFLEIELTTTLTLFIVFIPKIVSMFSKKRLVEGALSDVYGPMRVHKLTLVINKTGTVQSINCVPCGPLHDVTDDPQDFETETDIAETRENEYSKDEVNALIELTNKLKAEREMYKKRLQDATSQLASVSEKSLNNSSIDVSPPELMPSACLKESLSNSNKTLQCISPTSFWIANLSFNGALKSRFPSSARQSLQTLNRNNGFSLGDSSYVNTPESTTTLMTSVTSSQCNMLSPNNEDTIERDASKSDRYNRDQRLCWDKECLGELRQNSLAENCEHCRTLRTHMENSNRLSWPISPVIYNAPTFASKRISYDKTQPNHKQFNNEELEPWIASGVKNKRPTSIALCDSTKPMSYTKSTPFVFYI